MERLEEISEGRVGRISPSRRVNSGTEIEICVKKIEKVRNVLTKHLEDESSHTGEKIGRLEMTFDLDDLFLSSIDLFEGTAKTWFKALPFSARQL